MGLFRVDRARQDTPDPWLPYKVGLFVIGGLAAVTGMALRLDWLVTAAAVPLLIGILLRFIRR